MPCSSLLLGVGSSTEPQFLLHQKAFQKLVLFDGALGDKHWGLPWVRFMHRWGNLQVTESFRERFPGKERGMEPPRASWSHVCKWLCFLYCNTISEVRTYRREGSFWVPAPEVSIHVQFTRGQVSGPVVRQNILMGSMWQSKLVNSWKLGRKVKGKGQRSQYTFLGHAPCDLFSPAIS